MTRSAADFGSGGRVTTVSRADTEAVDARSFPRASGRVGSEFGTRALVIATAKRVRQNSSPVNLKEFLFPSIALQSSQK
jgi:hypothetical protein